MTVPKHWVTSFTIKERTLIVSFPTPRRIISSAVYGGGIKRAQHVLNHQVDIDPKVQKKSQRQVWGDPSRLLGRVAENLHINGPVVGLMTAVELRHLVLRRAESGNLWVEGFFTVGVTNAVRAGESTEKDSCLEPSLKVGTINMILVTNVRLASSAMVGAVGVATESKTATMLAKGIPSWTGQTDATGTGTDALVVVMGEGPSLRYSGTHTKIGELIARVVEEGVGEGLQLANGDTP